MVVTPAMAVEFSGLFCRFVEKMKADRARGIFRWGLIEFSRRVISNYRMQYGQKKLARDLVDLFD